MSGDEVRYTIYNTTYYIAILGTFELFSLSLLLSTQDTGKSREAWGGPGGGRIEAAFN